MFRCTECDRTYPTFDSAAHCHFGIGGVEEGLDPPTGSPAGERDLLFSNRWFVNGAVLTVKETP